MVHEVLGTFRHPVPRQIVRAGADDVAHQREPPGDQARILELADAHGEIEALVDEVDPPVVHVEDAETLKALKSVDFADICITSAITLTADPAPNEAFRLPEVPGVGVVFELAEGGKCQRCWKILPDVGTHAHPGICARCDAVL